MVSCEQTLSCFFSVPLLRLTMYVCLQCHILKHLLHYFASPVCSFKRTAGLWEQVVHPFEIHNSSLLNKTHVFPVLCCRCLLGKPGQPCAQSLRSQHDVDDDKIIVNLLNATRIYTRIHRTACIVSAVPFCLHQELRAGVHAGSKSTSWQKEWNVAVPPKSQ